MKATTTESRWTPIGPEFRRNRSRYQRCRCICGNETDLRIINGQYKSLSCGCANRGVGNNRHGHSPASGRSPTYTTWGAMRARCTDPKHSRWADYGGRGIRVCERWMGDDGFTNFLADMGERPAGKTLDRFPDRDGNYEPSNCRWASGHQQMRNMSRNRMVTAFGETKTLAEWTERGGHPRGRVLWRLDHGWSPEDAVSHPRLEPTERHLKRGRLTP